MRSHRLLRALCSLALAFSLLAACAQGDEPEAQPRQAGGFGTRELDNIPRHPGSEEVQRPTETDDTVTATYSVITSQPRGILRFYRDALADEGWTIVEPIEEEGRDVWRGTWSRNSQTLEVSASPASELERAQYENPSQYSLVLRPA